MIAKILKFFRPESAPVSHPKDAVQILQRIANNCGIEADKVALHSKTLMSQHRAGPEAAISALRALQAAILAEIGA